MKYFKLIAFSGLFSILFGCGSANHGTTTLEEITSKTDLDEGFADIFLKIVSDDKKADTHVYVAKGLYKGKTVGLRFEVKSDMSGGLTSRGEINSGGFVREAVRISSEGPESGEFANALGEIYEIPTTEPFTNETITTTAFSLNQTAVNLDKPDYYKFKLFFEDADEELYAELFFNIDTKKRIIELHEKDPEYRQALMTMLTKRQ